MPALSSAQLVVMLWLLAVAAAPAATALMNGSLVPLASEWREVRAESGVVLTVDEREIKRAQHRAVVSPVDFSSIPAFQKVEAGEQVVTLAWLHTGVQRHRPRGA